MLRLAMILYSLIGTTLAGSAVIAALTMGYGTLQPILIAAALGAALAVPVAASIGVLVNFAVSEYKKSPYYQTKTDNEAPDASPPTSA